MPGVRHLSQPAQRWPGFYSYNFAARAHFLGDVTIELIHRFMYKLAKATISLPSRRGHMLSMKMKKREEYDGL